MASLRGIRQVATHSETKLLRRSVRAAREPMTADRRERLKASGDEQHVAITLSGDTPTLSCSLLRTLVELVEMILLLLQGVDLPRVQQSCKAIRTVTSGLDSIGDGLRCIYLPHDYEIDMEKLQEQWCYQKRHVPAPVRPSLSALTFGEA